MNLQHVDDALDAYVDGELDAAARAAVEAHVAGCGVCRGELEARRLLQERIAALPVPDPGTRYWADFAARVEARTQTKTDTARGYERLAGWLFPGGRFAWPRAIGALATCTVLVYVGLRGFQPDRARMTHPAPTAPQVDLPRPSPSIETSAPNPPNEPQSGAPTAPTAPRPQGGGTEGSAPRDIPSGSTQNAKPARESDPPAAGVSSDRPLAKEKSIAQKTAPPPPAAAARGAESARPVHEPSPSDPAAAERAAPEESQSLELSQESGTLRSRALDRDATGATPPSAESRLDERTAVLYRMSPDAVLRFLHAADRGDVENARAIASEPGIASEQQRHMQRWLQLQEATTVGPGKPKSTAVPPAAAPRPNEFATDLYAKRRLESKLEARAPAVEALLELEALTWSQRDVAGGRDAVARSVQRLLPHAAVPEVAARARTALEWLVATSVSESERAGWQDQLSALREP